jgi:hypothetical protein
MSPETKVRTTRHNDMVQKTNVEELRRLGNTFRECHILTTRLGTTRRMVVHKNNLHGKQLQRTLDDEAEVYNSSLHTTLAYTHTFENLARRCKVQRPALLMLQASKVRLHDTHNIAIRSHDILSCGLGDSEPTTKLHSTLEAGGTNHAYATKHPQAHDIYIGKCE